MAFFGRRPQKPGSVPGAGSGTTPLGTEPIRRRGDGERGRIVRQERAGRNIRNARNERRAR